jgi:hypothetical protein
MRKNVPGLEDKATLTSMSLLASILSNQGKLRDAEQLNRQILAGREKLLGPENEDTATSRSKLAAVLNSQGKYGEAEAMHRQVLSQERNHWVQKTHIR